MTQHNTLHPKEFIGCVECGADEDTWHKMRRLPQIDQTYECAECGHEVYVYDAGDPGETSLQWRPVTRGMVTNLQFYSVVGDWPDNVIDDLMRQGVERAAAIDYHVVEREGLTQTEWADMRGAEQPSVSGNVTNARSVVEPSSE